MLSLAEKLILSNNRPAGFDYMRLVLSVAVIAWHSYGLAYGFDAAFALPKPWLAPVRVILLSFFALSGFLVAASLLRCKTMISFIGLRVIRIIPALTVEVFLSAIIIGGLMTSLKWSEYYTHPQFFKYFLNIVGNIRYHLPGVFENNPFPRVVNGQLWTIPWEFWCYFDLAIMSMMGFALKPKRFLLVTIVATIFYSYRGFVLPSNVGDFHPGVNLVLAFLWGVVMYLYKEKIPHNSAWALGSLVYVFVCLLFDKGSWFVVVPTAYLTVYFGAFNPKKVGFIRSGDYSYGLYLYGCPLQQVFAALGGVFASAASNFLATMAVGLLLSYFSWNYIELPTSQWRKHVNKLENKYLHFKSKVRLGFA